MTEIKLFNEWLETHEISTSAIALWYALMYIANRSDRVSELLIPVSVLSLRTKLSRSAIYKERAILRGHGLIDYDACGGRQSGLYTIRGFEERFVSTVVSATETQAWTQSENLPVASTVVSTTETQQWTQNEKTQEFVSTTRTQNPARVSPEADLGAEKSKKSPIYINKDIDIDKGGIRGKKKNDAKTKSPKKKKPEFDLSFVGDPVWEEMLRTWLEYKRSRNESYKSDLSVKKFHTMLRNLARGDPAIARRIIDKSIANNWAGIFELQDGGQPRGRSPERPATGQRIGQIKQPEDEERRRKLLEKFGSMDNAGKK